MNTRALMRDIAVLGSGTMAAILAQVVFRSVLVALLVPQQYGRLSLVINIYNTVWAIGASGLPSMIARSFSIAHPSMYSRILRSALRAGLLPSLAAAVVVALVSAIILSSIVAFIAGALGLMCLIYSLLLMGVLRGAARMGAAASILPATGGAEVVLLGMLLIGGVAVTPLTAFSVFCGGNVIGLGVGVLLVRKALRRSAGERSNHGHDEFAFHEVPSASELLSSSLWVTLATISIQALPLVLRLGVALQSYTAVAIVDVALLLFIFPQRLGAITVAAVVPHASKAVVLEDKRVTVPRKLVVLVSAPFLLGIAICTFTPIISVLAAAVGRPAYAGAALYLAIALVGGPPRILYGLIEGVLVAHGDVRFLGTVTTGVSVVAAVAIVAAAAFGSTAGAVSSFAIASWAIYGIGMRRLVHLEESRTEPLVPARGVA